MTCRDLSEFLAGYVSGELPPEERTAFREHLEQCPDCVTYLKSYQDCVALGKAAFRFPDDPVPDDVPEELVQAILAARRTRN